MPKIIILFSVIVALIAYCYYRSVGIIEGKIIKTKSGFVRGKVSLSRDGREFDEWLGIPFAKPPVGHLRFASPLPADKWSGIKDTTQYGSKCIQLQPLTERHIGSEDCLFLNIHAGKERRKTFQSKTIEDYKMTEKTIAKLPVLVFLHGGGFNNGECNNFTPYYFMDEDIVFVTISYRLSVFGFLSTGDAAIRGNMGLKDQVLALKWIKENIEAFGGDLNEITIFGESAGASSVHYHLLSPQTQGLFQRAISQSGVATMPWALNTAQVSKLFLERYAKSLDVKTNFVINPQNNGYVIGPTIEGVNDSEAFLVEHPIKIIGEGRASKVPWLTGLVADEGLLATAGFYKNEQNMKEYADKFDKQIFTTFNIPPRDSSEEIARQVHQYYFFKEIQTSQQIKDQFTKLFADAFFNVQFVRTVTLQRNFSPVYLFYYNKQGGPSIFNLLTELKGNYPLELEAVMIYAKDFFNEIVFGILPENHGVCHSDQLAMLFYMPFLFKVNKDSLHYQFSKDFVKFFVDFARGDPTLKFWGVEIPLANSTGDLQYLEINEVPKIISNPPFKDRISFLTSLNFHER